MTNTLYTNDNLFILNGLNSNLVDLIYLDPPFNSKRTYSASVGSKAAGSSFKDMWTWEDVNEFYLETLAEKYPDLVRFITSVGQIHSKPMMAYLTYMAQRIIEMHRILKDTGSFYLHCDPTASHYLKIVLDNIFGKNNFVNELVWCYKSGGATAKRFAKKHDIILLYSKKYDTLKFNSIKQKSYMGIGYTTGNKNVTLYDDTNGLGPYTLTNQKDWWEIPMLATSSKERTGYPTQKPLALLERIIKASSNEGDIVMDPFCGCATTCVAAQQLGRKWIGIDIEKNAVNVLTNRLKDDAGIYEDFISTDKIPMRTDIMIVEPNKSVKERLYKEQNGICNGCRIEFKIWNLAIDHIIPETKGGPSCYENYQLLCPQCNSIKGARPMEYLRMKIKVREDMMKNKIIFGE